MSKNGRARRARQVRRAQKNKTLRDTVIGFLVKLDVLPKEVVRKWLGI